jgi:peroxiredoxin
MGPAAQRVQRYAGRSRAARRTAARIWPARAAWLILAVLARSSIMTIKVGDRLPAGTLQEFFDVEKDGCAIGPNPVKVEDLTRGKKVVIFGLPGAFTPTCSAKHVPGYVANADKLKAKGVDTIACMSVNDAFVMGAWARDQKSDSKVRMLADGSADFTRALGLELDLNARGMGTRCQRFSMLVDDGVVKALNIEAPGKFEVSNAETMLTQLG